MTMPTNNWIEIKDTKDLPWNHDEPLLFWNRYEGQVYCGYLGSYDGAHVLVCTKEWSFRMSLKDFTHWQYAPGAPK
jgi:hypothetical protein